MAPSPRRRGSVALSMLDQTTAPRLESVLKSVHPPSEDAAVQVVDGLVALVVWKKHRQTLDAIARACGARHTITDLTRVLSMSSEFMVRDFGECGLATNHIEGDETVLCEIDVRARGRLGTAAQSTNPEGDIFLGFDEASEISVDSASETEVALKGKGVLPVPSLEGRPPSRHGLAQSPQGVVVGRGCTDDVPIPAVLNFKRASGSPGRTLSRVQVAGDLSRRDSGAMAQVSGRSESSAGGRSVASSARSVVHPAMARLFDMADRRQAGWLNVTDIQIFLEYHGHKRWAHPSYIRNTLVALGASKGGNEPIKKTHFSRFLLHLIQQDPLMEFAARPLPPDQLLIGVPEQARALAGILKEEASRHLKPTIARRRLNRALTSPAGGGGGILPPSHAPPVHLSRGLSIGEARTAEGKRSKGGGEGPDEFCHQVSPQVSVRDVTALSACHSRRPSTVPVTGGGVRYPQRRGMGGLDGSGVGGRAAGTAGGGREKALLEAFLSPDHSVQESLVQANIDLRPGVTVQEMGVPVDGGGSGEGREKQEVVRSRSGPPERQVPGRLTRSAYKALARKQAEPELPVGLVQRPTTTDISTVGGGAGDQSPLYRGGGEIKMVRGGTRKGVRPSTAPVALHSYFSTITAEDGPDPRLLGGSKVFSKASAAYDGGDSEHQYSRGDPAMGERRPDISVSTSSDKTIMATADQRVRGWGRTPGHEPDGSSVPPIFGGEDVGCSSALLRADEAGSHALIPRGGRPLSSARGATRARVSSPGLGARGGKRGGRAVAAW